MLLPHINIFSIATFFIASLAGPKYFLGSLSFGLFTNTSLSVSANGIFNSVAIFTFVIPNSIAFLTCSAGTPDAPCNTNGTSTTALISASLSKSSFGSSL